MIKIHLTDSERQLQEATSKFVRETLNPLEARILASRSVENSKIALIRQDAATLGILAPNIPKKFDGNQRSFPEICIISEGLGKALPVLRQICQSPPRILCLMNDKFIEQYLKPCAEGKKACAVVWDDAHSTSDGIDFPTTAELHGDNWIIDGGTYLVENGSNCDFFVVFASVEDESGSQPAAFVVDRQSPGVHFSDDGKALKPGGITLFRIGL